MTVSILPDRLPADPLLRLVSLDADTYLTDKVTDRDGKPRLPAQELARLLGVSKRAVCCWLAGGLSVTQADRLTAAMGLHPILVWGPDEWDRANDAHAAERARARAHGPREHPDRCARCGVPHVRR